MPTGDGPPAFLPVRPITQVHLAKLTERVRRRVIRWFRLTDLLDASAAPRPARRSRPAAVEHSGPSLQVTNDDIIKELLARSARHLDVPSSALLARTLEALFKRSRSVVRYRHVAPEKAIDFGVDAGRQAIATAGMVPEDIDLLIYVGVSRGFLEPATANVFQHELGFTKATCFDVLDACAGNE